ncbi:hypothetical protein GCM10028805_26700 [Spirosoma harenae]
MQNDTTKDMVYQSQRTFPDEATAREAFGRSIDKLFRVNDWSALSSLASDFKVYSQAGEPKTTVYPEVSDFIQISLPGPVPENWVQVTHRMIEDNRAAFTVRPSRNPRENNPAEIEHFFHESASSTFQVERIGKTITAAEIGKNEGINNEGPQAGNRAIINTIIAEVGWLFYQKLQWKLLTDYLVEV